MLNGRMKNGILCKSDDSILHEVDLTVHLYLHVLCQDWEMIDM